MKTLYFLLLAWPVGAWAQSEPLKPIETTTYSAPHYTHYGYRYGNVSRYLYDGIEVRRSTELGKYILASGDANAIHEYRQFQSGRKVGTTMLVVGGVASVVGLIIAATPKVVHEQSLLTGSLANYNGPWYTNGQVVYGNPYATLEKKEMRKGGMITLATGLSTALIGSLIRIPGFHFHRSIQYYNKSLRTKDVSLRLEPHWDYTNAGAGLVARF